MKFDYDQKPTDAQILKSAEYMMGLVDFATAMVVPELLGEAYFANAILAYRDQSEGKKLNLRPDLREKVDQLTEFLVERSRVVDGVDQQEALETEDKAKEAKVFGYNHQQIKEELSPVLDALAELGIPQESLDKAVKFTAVVMETLIDLTGDEETALEVYDQLDPAFAPLAVLAYRKQAEGHEFAEGELEPEIRKEVDRLTEILVELSRKQDAEDADEIVILAELSNAEDLVARLERLRDSLERALETAEPADEIDHYEDYRLSTGYPWNGEDSEDSGYAYGEDDESAHQRLQEDILRAARKNGGYVLATREVWAKPVAKTDDGRWVFETEYGLEYLDFEDYEFEPEFDSFEDEESLVDFD